MPKWSFEVHLVHVVAAAFASSDVPRLDEVVGDAVHRTFADADHPGYFGQAHLRVLRDAEQHMCVIGEKGPVGHARGVGNEATRHI